MNLDKLNKQREKFQTEGNILNPVLDVLAN